MHRKYAFQGARNMQSRILTICFAWCLLPALLPGCGDKQHYQEVNSPRSTYVPSLPPVAKHEAVPARPSSAHVWVKGSWHWNYADEKWTWKKGAWKKPPKKGYQWRVSTYDKRREGVVVYTPGHWVAKKAAKSAVNDR